MQIESDRTLTARLEANDAMAAQAYAEDGMVDKGRKKSVTQMRVSVQNSVNTVLGRIDRATEQVDLSYKGALEQFGKVQVEETGAKEILAEAKAELDKTKAAIIAHAAGAKERVKSLRGDLAQAENVDALELVKNGAQDEISSLLKHETMKAYNFTVCTFRRNMMAAKRTDALDAGAARARARGEEQEPPLFFVTIGTVLKNLKDTTSSSLFEAKAGIRAALFDVDASLKVGTKRGLALDDMAVCKKIKTSLDKALKTQEHVMDRMDPTTAKKLDKMLSVVLPDKALLQQYAVNLDAAWSQDFTRKRFFAMKAPFFHVGFPAYGASEVRVVLSGSLVYCGVKTEAVPGDTLKKQRELLYNASRVELEELIKKDGWIAEVGAGQGILVPTGFITMMLCPSVCTFGLSWHSYADQQDKLRAMRQLSQLTDEYSECRTPQTGYMQLLDFFRAS